MAKPPPGSRQSVASPREPEWSTRGDSSAAGSHRTTHRSPRARRSVIADRRDQLAVEQRADEGLDLGGELGRRHFELVEEPPLDLAAVAVGAQELPQPRPGAIQDVDLVGAGVDEDDLVADAGGERIRARP